MTDCKNCANEFEGKYCPACGQKASTKRFSTRILFSDLIDKIFPLDRGVLFTSWSLVTRPGPMLREYLDGKRAGYTKPLQFLLIVVAVSLIFFSRDQFEQGMKVGMTASSDSAQSAQVREIQQKIMSFISANLTVLITGMLPFLALVGRWFYKKHQVNYAEHFVMNSYLLGGCTMLSIPFMFALRCLGESIFSPIVSAGFGVLYVGYYIWGHVTFFKERNKWWNAAKGMFTILLAYLLYILAFMILGVIAVVVYMLVLKKG